MIRPAEPSDAYQVIQLARKFHRESYFNFIPVCDEKIIDLLAASSNPARRVFVRVSDDCADINGLMMGFVSTYWFSNQLGAFDYCFYVAPEKRGSMIAHRLWRAFRDWASEQGAVDLTHGVSSGISIDSSHRFFTGVGMEHVGGLYKLALPKK
jgi:GNAT superfamily N-acetyltransferase